jgi:phosphoribosylamine--glycine ligase
MRANGIPTADFQVFEDYEEARSHIEARPAPLVVKADGLAAGKGSLVCRSRQQAQQALRQVMVERAFGGAGDRVVIEECLVGEEVSILAFADGEHLMPMAPAQDHKAVFDGDRGPNTGGMGCYAPAPIASPELMKWAMDEVLAPTVRGMAAIDRPYRGALYAGLMVTGEGPKVLEFNCRFGDPENQVIMPLLEGSMTDILGACIDGRLDEVDVGWRDGASVCVVLASGGYPGAYETGREIRGLEGLAGERDIVAFHAGTALEDGELVTSGGRVLGITSVAPSLKEAIRTAYRGVAKVHFQGMHYRRDIGAKALRGS